MKHGPHSIQRDAYPRSSTFGKLGALGNKQGLNVGPIDIRPDRLGENRLKRAIMLTAHFAIVSNCDTNVNGSPPDQQAHTKTRL